MANKNDKTKLNNDAIKLSKKRLDSEIDLLEYSFQNVQNLAEFADSKANGLIVIHTLIITILSGILIIGDVSDVFLSPDGAIEYIGTILIIVVFFLLIISTIFSLSVIYPREAPVDQLNPNSIFYYKHISTQHENYNSFYDSFKSLPKEKIAIALADQAYVVAGIVDKKFRYIRYSIIFMIGYLGLLILTVFVFLFEWQFDLLFLILLIVVFIINIKRGIIVIRNPFHNKNNKQ